MKQTGIKIAPPASAASYIVLDQFLAFEEWQQLLDYALQNRGRFDRSMVLHSSGASELDKSYRRSRILFELGPFHALFSRRLMTVLPYVLWRLSHPAFPVSHLEIQLTATNDAEFFRPHADNGAGDVSGRQITFVYYFHREPRRFGGGELRIFRDAEVAAGNHYELIYPIQNQAVFFCSSSLHEVLPVVCPTGSFENSRFTVNGWYHV